MKKVLIAVPVFVVAFGLLMVGIDYMLPKEYHIERSVFIEGDGDEVFGYVNDLEKWEDWSFWTTENIEELEVTMGEQTVGVGASQTWTEQGMKGQMRIVESVNSGDVRRIKTELEFEGFPPMVSTIEITPAEQEIKDADGNVVRTAKGVNVVWSSDGAMNTDVGAGWFGLIMPSMIGVQYDYGLNRLNGICSKETSNDSDDPDENESSSSDADDENGSDDGDSDDSNQDDDDSDQDDT